MSDRIMRWLDESQQLADEATDGPWEADLDQRGETRGVWPTRPGVEQIIGAYVAADGFDSQGWTGGTDENLTFIAEARTRLPQAVAALKTVMDLHRPLRDARDWSRRCGECEQPWPCLTVQAIQEALGTEDGSQ